MTETTNATAANAGNPANPIESARPALDPEALLRAPRMGGSALSPDGTQVAFAWNRDGQFQLYTVPVAGGEPAQLTRSADAAQTPLWSPDGKAILFRRDHDGDENTNLFLISAEGARPTQSPTTRIRQTVPPPSPRMGRRLSSPRMWMARFTSTALVCTSRKARAN